MAKRAKLTGEKTKSRKKQEALVDEQTRLRKQRSDFDIEASGGSVEDPYGVTAAEKYTGAAREVPVDPAAFAGGNEGREIASAADYGQDIGDLSDPDYLMALSNPDNLSEMFGAAITPGRLSSYSIAKDRSLGGFMPNYDAPYSPKRGRSLGDVLREESAGRAAEPPRLMSTDVKAAKKAYQERAAGLVEGLEPGQVPVPSADRPPGFSTPKPYSIGSMQKAETEAGVKSRLVSEVKSEDYFERTRRRSPQSGLVGPRPSEKSLAEVKAWAPKIDKPSVGRITFPTAEEAAAASDVVSGLGALFGQAPVTPEIGRAAITETVKEVQRRAPLYTREGLRVTPNPDNPTERGIIDTATSEGALREVVARKRGGKFGIQYLRATKTARSGTGAGAKEARRIVNPAKTDVDPADPDYGQTRDDILQSNLRAYRKATGSNMKGTTWGQLVAIMGIDEMTSGISERELSSAPLGAKVYEERIPGRYGGPRVGGEQQPSIQLNPAAQPAYKYERGPATKRFGVSMPTPTIKGIEDLRARSPKAALGLESGMYTGTPGAQAGTVKWERGEVPVWRRPSESVPGQPGVTAERLPAPPPPPSPEERKPTTITTPGISGRIINPNLKAEREQRVVEESMSNVAAAGGPLAGMVPEGLSRAAWSSIPRGSAKQDLAVVRDTETLRRGGAMGIIRQSNYTRKLNPATGEWERVAKSSVNNPTQFGNQ